MRQYRVKDVFDVLSGSTPSTAKPEYWDGALKWITPKDLSGLETATIEETERRITTAGFDSCSAQLIPKGSIIISSRAPIGYVAVLEDEMSCNQGCKALVPKGKVDPLYVYYLLRSKKRELNNMGTGSTFKELSKSKLEEFPIRLPDYEAQKEIAHILSQADRARQQRKAANGLTEQFLQSTFLSLFGDPVRNEKGWEVKHVSRLIAKGEKISYGVVQPGDDNRNGIPIIRVGDFSGLTISNAKLKRIDPAIESKYTRTRIRGSEILIACVGSIGKVALVDDTQIGFNIVRAVARISPNENEVNRFYLAYYLSTPLVQSYFTNETKTVAQPTLNIKQIEATEILLPPLKLQQQFAAIVAQTEALRQRQRAHAAELEGMFQGLLQRYFG